jgi:hypothetical protein
VFIIIIMSMSTVDGPVPSPPAVEGLGVVGAALLGELDAELAPLEHLTVHAVQGILRVLTVHEAHEGEATRRLGAVVHRDVAVPYAPIPAPAKTPR